MTANDLNLLREFSREHSQGAFTTLVRRHLDLVYSAALRHVRSPQLAEEVAQSVFTDLARNVARFKADTILPAWLCKVTRRTAINVVRGETRRQLREQIATEMSTMNADPDWTHIEPLLDEAMHALDETDRAAVLLRYFENKSLREVGQALGTSDDAAQKRVRRAVERLREFFAKRGVHVGASGLVVVITANAVQAAPVGLAAAISNAAALSGTNFTTAGVIAVTKAISMTTLQKAGIASTIAILVAAGLYEAREAASARTGVQILQQQQVGQIQQLQRERDAMAQRVASLIEQNAILNRNTSELLRLRGQMTAMQSRVEPVEKDDPLGLVMKSWIGRVKEFKRLAIRMPDKAIPELNLLTEEDWLELAKEPLGHNASEVNLEDDAVARLAFSAVRVKAKDKLMRALSRALEGYAEANSGQLPPNTVELKPYLMNKHFLGPARVVQIPEGSVDDTVLERYQVLQSGKLMEASDDAMIIAEKAPVDTQYDSRLEVGKYWMAVDSDTNAYSKKARMDSDGGPIKE